MEIKKYLEVLNNMGIPIEGGTEEDTLFRFMIGAMYHLLDGNDRHTPTIDDLKKEFPKFTKILEEKANKPLSQIFAKDD